MGIAGPQVEMGEIGPPWFDQKPIAIVGGGASLAGHDLTRLHDKAHVIAVKGAIFDLPWADCGVGADLPRLYEWLKPLSAVTMPVFWALVPQLWALGVKDIPKRKKPDGVTFLDKKDGASISTDTRSLFVWGTSGSAALGFAIQKRGGVRHPIYLFGFDYGGNAAGQYHWNKQHYRSNRPQEQTYWDKWASGYSVITPHLKAMGIQVINASPESRIACFPKVTFEQACQSLDRC